MSPTAEETLEQPPADPMMEIRAMTGVAEALKGLERQPIERVLDWANKHYLGRPAPTAKQKAPAAATAEAEGAEGDGAAERTDFPTFLSSARTSSAIDRALLAGYYFQVVVGQTDFDGFSLNRELKNAGHASGNITRDLDGLIAKTPQLVMQTRKHGNTKQARKLYRLTAAGLTAAKAMLGTAPATE
jgi:hypothetical protein